jgi:hypothetical protein
LSKNKPSDREEDGKKKQESWKHSTSKKEINALKAMMQKNAQNLKKKQFDDEKKENE